MVIAMAATRKLQGEIDRCLKKVSEGVETFEDIWQKVHNATNTNQKEKYETDLKKEIKKLQRLRDQIKSWIASGDIKDKSTLVETRKLIEAQMERFKVVERETKTKAYSKEGLGAAQKLDPTTREREDLNGWLVSSIDQMQIQVDQFESEIESLMAGKKKRLDKEKQERLDELRSYIDKHRNHQSKLETLMRMLDNLSVDVNSLRKFLSQVKNIKDDIDYYLVSHHEQDFEDNEYLYDDIDGLDEFDDGLVQQNLGNMGLSTTGDGEGGTPTSITSGNNSPVSPIHSSDSSSDPEKRRKSSDDSSKVVRPVAMKANYSPSPGSKGVVGTPPKSVGTPNNSSPSSGLSNHVSSLSSLSSSPTQTHNYHNALNNVKSLSHLDCVEHNNTTSAAPTISGDELSPVSKGTPAMGIQHPGSPSESMSGVATANGLSSTNGPDEVLHLGSSNNHSNQHPHLLNSIDLTAPSPPGTPSTTASSIMSSSGLATMSAAVLNSASMVVTENGLSPPPLPVGADSSNNSSLSTAVAAMVGGPDHLQQQLLSESLSNSTEAHNFLHQTLGGFVTSSSSAFASNNVNSNVSTSSTLGVVNNGSSNNVIVGSSGLTNSSASGAINNVGSNTGISTVTSILPTGVSVSSHNNSSVLSQQQQQFHQLQHQASTSQAGSSRDTLTISDLVRLQQEQLMNRLLHPSEGESMASLKSMAQEVVDRAGLNLNDPNMLENKTIEAHIPPLLGVAPLGPVPLQKEHQYQFSMLDNAHYRMPVGADSERMRQFLPRNPYPTPHYYPQHPLSNSDTLEFFQRLSIETLFFIFYYLEGTKAQYLAAKVLKKQSWRFHTKYMMWFQRHEEPKVINEEFEQGTYIYFDIEKWGQRKKDGFVFEYRYLEDRDLS